MKKLYRLSALAAVAMLVVIGSVVPLALPASAAPLRALSDNLQCYWKLEEASGTRIATYALGDSAFCDLSDNNTVTQNTGKLGYAAQFVAANSEYLSIADNANLSTADIDFMIAAWVYRDSNVDANIVSKQDTGASSEYSLVVASTSNKINWYVGANANMISTQTLAVGSWYFIVAWHDSVNNLT